MKPNNAARLVTALSMSTFCFGAKAGPGDHYIANHCEIFVNNLYASFGRSHSSHNVGGMVKILPFRLDGAVKEVGFRRARAEGVDGCRISNDQYYGPWRDIPMVENQNFPNNYDVAVPESVSSDMHSLCFKGAFYVITSVGTTYWAKAGPSKAEDFVFDQALYNFLMDRPEADQGASTRDGSFSSTLISTQAVGMQYFNPDGCY